MCQTRIVVLLSVAVLLISSCAGSSSAPDTVNNSDDAAEVAEGTVTIGPDGGSVTAPGGAVLTVPEGALTEEVTLAMTTAEAPATDGGWQFVGPILTITPAGTQFDPAATLTIPVDAGALPGGKESEVTVVTRTASGEPWTDIGGEYANGMVTVEVAHLSEFGPAIPATECNTETCDGCCFEGACLDGTAPERCGTGGDQCLECTAAQSCVDGECVVLDECNGETCPNGCCQGNTCLPGNANDACGTMGFQCGPCAENLVCMAGDCLCPDGDPPACNGLCCADDEVCFLNECCKPECEGAACGDDLCGGSCGECEGNFVCDDDPVSAVCICEEIMCGEECCAADQVCYPNECCTPDCEMKSCGGDGCGGDCGQCGDNSSCEEELGKAVCVCDHEACGEGCCAAGETCFEAACCKPNCAGAECGDDGCGGTCGECPSNQECDNNELLPPKCICAEEECGGNCCVLDEVCYDGACCLPLCDDAQCGDDTCGGTCGECDEGQYCLEQQCETAVPCDPTAATFSAGGYTTLMFVPGACTCAAVSGITTEFSQVVFKNEAGVVEGSAKNGWDVVGVSPGSVQVVDGNDMPGLPLGTPVTATMAKPGEGNITVGFTATAQGLEATGITCQ